MSALASQTAPERLSPLQRLETLCDPGSLRVVFIVLRHRAGPVWRRLPLG